MAYTRPVRWTILLTGLVALASLAACGSRKVASEGGPTTTTTTTTTTTGPSETGESTASTSTSMSGETDGGDEMSGGFVPEDDFASPSDCSVLEQDCDPGHKCVPTWSAMYSPSRCVPILGDKGVDEPCTFDGYEDGTDDCDADSHCWPTDWNEDPPYAGVCRPLCTGGPSHPTCPGQGQSCDSYVCYIIGQIGVLLCQIPCDPLGQDCPPGQACYYDGGYLDFFCGVVANPGQPGEPCETFNDCAAGSYCASAEAVPACEASYCCAPFCSPGDDSDCAALPGSECSDPLQAKTEQCPPVGLCLTPGF